MSNPLPSVPSSGTAAELENKSNRVAHSEETEEADYSVIEAALQPERVLQLGILGLTTHLAYEKYYKMDIEHMDIMNMALIALVSIGVGAYSSFKASRGNIALLPDFNVVYLIFLPTMLSLLFDQRHAAANIALILNYMQISPFYGLPMQMIFIAFHAMDLSVEEKYTYLAAVPINYAISSVLSRISQLKSLDNVDCNIFSILLTNVLYLNESTSLPFRVLKKTLTAFILVVSINYLICMLLRPMSNSIAKSMILFGVFLCGFPYAVKRLLVIDGLDPLVWLINYIANSKLRQTILLIWLCSLTILIPLSLIHI